MVRFFIFAALVTVALTIYTLIECGRTERYRIRSLSKQAWILVILLIPLLGAGLWFLLGRPLPPEEGGPAPRSNAPDDDEDFLRQLEVWRRQQQREAELNAREEELKRKKAKPDPKDKNPGDTPDNSPDSPSDNSKDG